MSDKTKTKAQLVAELQQLRRENSRLKSYTLDSENQCRYWEFIEQSSEGIYLMELDPPMPTNLPVPEQIKRIQNHSKFLECNPSFVRMYGFSSPDELVGRYLKDIKNETHKNDKDKEKRGGDSFISSGYRLLNVETKERDLNGNMHYFLNNATGLIKDGHLVNIWGTQIDITSQRRAEEALKANKKRLDIAVNATRVGLWDWNIPERQIIVNDQWQEMLGYTNEELQSFTFDDWEELIHPDHLPALKEYFLEHTAEQADVFEAETKIRHKDGSWRWILIHAQITKKDEKGTPVRIIGTNLDITQQKCQRDLLQNQYNTFKKIAITAQEMLKFSDPDKLYAYIGKKLSSFIDKSIVLIFNTTDDGEHLVLHNYAGLKSELVSKVKNVLGFEPSGKLYEIDPDFKDEYSKTQLTEINDNLDKLAKIVISPETAKKVSDILGLDKIYTIGLTGQQEMVGSVLIFVRKDAAPVNTSLVETFVHQASLALELTQFIKRTQKSEFLYRTLLENQGEGAGLVDLDENILFFNPAGARIYGQPFESITGRNILEFCTQEAIERIKNETQKRKRNEKSTYEHEIIRGDGRKAIVQVTATPYYDEKGQLTGSFAVFRDVTKQRHDEQIRQLNEDRLNSLYKQSQMTDASERDIIDFALNEAVRLTKSDIGYLHFVKEEQVNLQLFTWSGKVKQMCSADKNDHYPLSKAGIWADCLRSAKPVIHNDYENFAKKKGLPAGHVPINRHMSIPVYDDGKPILVAGVGNKESDYDNSDVRQLSLLMEEMWKIISNKRVQENLRRNEARFRNLFENSPIALWEENFSQIKARIDELKTKGVSDFGEYFEKHPEFIRQCIENIKVIDINEAALKLVNARDKAELFEKLPDLFTPKAFGVFKQELLAFTEGNILFEHEASSKTLNDELKHTLIRCQIAPGTEEDWSRVLVSILDITDKKRLEEQVRQSQKMEAIGTLAGGVAHDFNNLLTVINGYAQMTMGKLGEESLLYTNVSAILKAGERAEHLTRQLLAFSRKQVYEPKIINLSQNISDSSKMLRRLIPEDIDMHLELDNNLPPIKADPNQIEQVVMNLSVNARDAIRAHKGRAMKEICIATSAVELDEEYIRNHFDSSQGNYICLSVSDTGIGMEASIKNKIFDPFFSLKEKGKGTGLGLSTVYGIVKQNRGDIRVYSEPGEGTTFKIYWPVSDKTVDPKKSSREHVSPPAGTENILLVEDEEDVSNIASQTLSNLGYKVYTAASGRSALNMLTEKKLDPDLLITDVIMPGMNGKKLATEVTNIFPDIKTLFMSGYTSDYISESGVLDSDIHFISKPFSTRELAIKVRKILDS